MRNPNPLGPFGRGKEIPGIPHRTLAGRMGFPSFWKRNWNAGFSWENFPFQSPGAKVGAPGFLKSRGGKRAQGANFGGPGPPPLKKTAKGYHTFPWAFGNPKRKGPLAPNQFPPAQLGWAPVVILPIGPRIPLSSKFPPFRPISGRNNPLPWNRREKPPAGTLAFGIWLGLNGFGLGNILPWLGLTSWNPWETPQTLLPRKETPLG